MRTRLLILTCILGISMLTACGATENAENAVTENQVVESIVEEKEEENSPANAEIKEEKAEVDAEVREEVTEESTEAGTEVTEEATEESTETVTEEATEEMSAEDALLSLEEMLAQLEQEAMEKAKEEAESNKVAPEKEYDFPEGYDSNKYTWRQTTADRDLYWMEGDKELIGKEFIGETFEEILQMAEDPTCDFDEANFWNATCFKGLTVKDTEYLVSKGYNVDQLINMIIENGVGNVYELNIW